MLRDFKRISGDVIRFLYRKGLLVLYIFLLRIAPHADDQFN